MFHTNHDKKPEKVMMHAKCQCKSAHEPIWELTPCVLPCRPATIWVQVMHWFYHYHAGRTGNWGNGRTGGLLTSGSSTAATFGGPPSWWPICLSMQCCWASHSPCTPPASPTLPGCGSVMDLQPCFASQVHFSVATQLCRPSKTLLCRTGDCSGSPNSSVQTHISPS